MAARYHRIAGQSLDRLSALSDGIFAVAMTLLVLDLRAPAEAAWRARPLWSASAVDQERPVWQFLGHVGPQLLICLLGFLTLGMFWIGQQTALALMDRGDRNFAWIHLTFLFGIALIPFTTALLATFPTSRLALVVYWVDLLALGMVQLAGLRYSRRAGLLKADASPQDVHAIRRRIAIVQLLYGLSVALCVVDPRISIGMIIALQLNSAISPPIRPLNRF